VWAPRTPARSPRQAKKSSSANAYTTAKFVAHTLMIAAIRYLDSMVKRDGRWLIRQRQVAVDWTESRPLATG